MATNGRTIAVYIPARLWREARALIDPGRDLTDKEVEAEVRTLAKARLEEAIAEGRRR